MTLLQSPGRRWRIKRIDGYHGVVSANPHLGSATTCRSKNVGTPKLPARWATDVSTVTTASSPAIRFAVSTNEESGSDGRATVG
jgi:hypothetical protein